MSGPANATTTDTGRTYTWPPTGEVFDSVTTVIKGGTPTGYGLIKWFKTVPAEYAVRKRALWLPIAEDDEQAAIDLIAGGSDRKRDAAAIRGTDIHEWAEKIILGTAVGEAPVAIRPYVEQFAAFLREWTPTFHETEATVYARSRLPHAGTLDWTAEIPGHGLVLGDIKTKPDGKRLYGEGIGLQLAAYRYADFIGRPDGTEEPLPKFDECLALVIHPSSYELIPVRAGRDVHATFLSVAEVRRYCEVDARTVLGRRLTPPKVAA